MEATAMKLWEITDEYESVLMEVFANDGELTPELEARLDELEGTFLDFGVDLYAEAERVEREWRKR